jgi:hypothetical protein
MRTLMARAWKRRAAVLTVAVLAAAGGAEAEVKAAAPDGMTLEIVAESALSREAMWTRLLDIGSWWSDAHTYSGVAANLRLDAIPGGCWCELWRGAEVQHGEVLLVMPRESIRFRAELGPLQELGVSGALTFAFEGAAAPAATKVRLTYRVSGSSLSGLDKLAPVVDQVLAEQVARLTANPG